jgi:hypothetical protein
VSSVDQPGLIHRHHQRGRVQAERGLVDAVRNWQHLQIYRKASAILESRNELTERRKRAIAGALWPLAHWIAYTHLKEACEVASWIYTLDPNFHPPESGLLRRLYERLGFRRTEQLLKLRRVSLALLRAGR